jgi:hypothetical protein
MHDLLPPPPAYVESMYRQVVPHLLSRGLAASHVRAGCARCNACSAMSAFERSLDHVPDARRLPVLGTG